MEKFSTIIWGRDEYEYQHSFGFVPNLTFYVHKNSKKRPFIIVVPGGAYGAVSPTESEIVAEEFFDKGFNVGVLCYTTNILNIEPLRLQPMKDLGRAIRYVRRNKGMLNLLNEEVVVCGFSAGAHLCASIAVHHEDVIPANEKYEGVSAKPSAVILSYPVITSGEYAHQGSFKALLGKDAFENPNCKEDLEYFSLEKQVNENTAPCFLWHTATDVPVPAENSYLFALALQRAKIPHALHIFSDGEHGLSLANERWEKGKFGVKYTLYQSFKSLEALENGEIDMPEEEKQEIFENFAWVRGESRMEKVSNKEAEVWTELAKEWVLKILGHDEI